MANKTGNTVTPKPTKPTTVPPVRRPVTGNGQEGYPDATSGLDLGEKPHGGPK